MPQVASPRKVVPLASGDDRSPRPSSSAGPSVTKRVFFCGVVVEGSENGRRLREDVQDLVVSLGVPVNSRPAHNIPSSLSEKPDVDRPPQRMRAMTDTPALSDVINELLSTERSYVKRLRTLKYDYADPLRKFSRTKDTAILPPYEAKTLFGNIDNLVPVNEAFLADLEKLVAPSGSLTVGGIGDVALKHFKTSRGFEHYRQYYIKREEAQAIFEREIMRRSSGFAAFVDRIKYSSADTKNRVGLRELLINPVQRVPQYTLLFRTMMKHMALGDTQRAKLVEAEDIASKIALAETDEETKRAAIMFCLSATVDGFPPALVSSSRRFIDYIDVEDVPVEPAVPTSSSSSSVSTPSPLHCTLFLFDDKLMIVKRPGNGEKSGGTLAGLHEVDKLTKAGGASSMKKSGMVCKGVVDVTDIVATDVGGPGIHLYLENPPHDQGDRWSGRPFRSLSVEHPPLPVNLEPIRTEADKKRFLENLWKAQATFRARAGQSVVLCTDETEVESRAGKTTIARTYFNIYQRTAFLKESKKTKIVVHIDGSGSADPIPFGIGAPPFVVVRVQPMAGELSRYTVTSNDPNDDGEEDIVQTARIPSRVVQTIHHFGLFKFKTDNNSLPSTPTHTGRSRTTIFGLDAISRNLFNSRPGSAVGDLFGASANTHKRSKSTTSRSSIYTQSNSTGDDSLTKFSRRSNSTATAATTVSIADEDSFNGRKSPSKSRKLVKRGKSPCRSEGEFESPSRRSTKSDQTSATRSRSRSESTDRRLERNDDEASHDQSLQKANMDQSEWDLTMQLELARKNSNQHGKQISALGEFDRPVEGVIYEEPPLPRPPSRASRDVASRSTITPRPQSAPPAKGPDPSGHSRSASEQSSERRLFGPRSPSPLLPKSPVLRPSASPQSPDQLPVEKNLVCDPHGKFDHTRTVHSPLPRSKRQPFLPTGNTETTPKPPSNSAPINTGIIEPLSIKKKVSVRSSCQGTPTPARKAYSRNSPLSRNPTRIISLHKASPPVRSARSSDQNSPTETNIAGRVMKLVQSSRDDVESSRRAVKRIKRELDDVLSGTSHSVADEQRSSDKRARTAAGGNTMTKEAQERMEEMRQLIGKRQTECTPSSRPHSVAVPNPSSSNISDSVRSVEDLLSDADKDLSQALENYESLQNGLTELTSEFKQRTEDLEKARVELQNAKRQCELIKRLLADATAEKDIMYEAFNEELDGMYNDVNLPEDEAWVALSTDLRQTKEARNALSKQNSELTRRLAELEVQKEEWGALLRTHGLIP